MTLNEYKQMLDNLDPSFGYADDYSAYRDGKGRWDCAARIAKNQGGVYKQAWKEYNDRLLERN